MEQENIEFCSFSHFGLSKHADGVCTRVFLSLSLSSSSLLLLLPRTRCSAYKIIKIYVVQVGKHTYVEKVDMMTCPSRIYIYFSSLHSFSLD